MNARSAWQHFWFPKDGHYLDLAVVRILAVGLQCYLLLNERLDDITYVLNLPQELWSPVYAVRVLTFSIDGSFIPSASLVYSIYGVTVICGLMALVGLLTNPALFVFAFGSIFLQGFEYSFGDYHHPQAIMMVALVALALSPSGRVLSVDAWLWRRNQAGVGERTVRLLDFTGPHAAWPIRLIQVFFPLMYLSAAFGKLSRSGVEWMNGFTLQAIMIQDYYRHGSELALWLSQQHLLLWLAQISVIVFQLTFFLIIFFPRLRWIYLPVGLTFHLMIYFTLRAGFWEWIILYAAFVPWALAFKRLTEQQVVVARQPA